MDIIITGIGGQGTVSIGHLLCKAAELSSTRFVSAETHGMAQRGGSVVFHLRIGNKRAPLIPLSTADLIVAGEPLEALRCIAYLKPNGIIITSKQGQLSPVARQLGMQYPNIDDLMDALRKWPSDLKILDTKAIAQVVGVDKSENIILLGFLSAMNILPFPRESLEHVVELRWPKFKENNLMAFNAGFNAKLETPIIPQ